MIQLKDTKNWEITQDHPRTGRPRTARTPKKIKVVRERIRRNPRRAIKGMAESLGQRGPTTGPRAACGPRNNFAQVLSITSSGNLFFLENAMIWGRKQEFRPIEDLYLLFFFFREHPEFGTKISVFSRLRPANSNNFEKWPTRVEKLDHPSLGISPYSMLSIVKKDPINILEILSPALIEMKSK